MVGGMTPVRADVIPFALAYGENLIGPNVVGLRRRGVTRAEMHQLRRAYRALFAGEGAFADRIDAVDREFADQPMVKKVIAFIRAGEKRPLMQPRAGRAGDDAA
jgi:UDP-N-acetylglucosamine acyltransferase